MASSDTGIYIGDSELGRYAKNAAVLNGTRGTVSGAAEAAAVLRALRKLRQTAAEGERAGRAGEWLMDNRYLAEREGRSAAAELKNATGLPKNAKTGRAAAAEAAASLIRAGRGAVTEERLALFLDAYQEETVLSERELALFVPFLKAELVLFLAALFADKEADGEAAAAAFTSLRMLASLDAADILEQVDRVERELRRDPAGLYALMDAETRADYRRELARLAKRAGLEPREAARAVLALAERGPEKHVGHYLFTEPLGREKKEPTGGWYIAVNVLATAFLTLLTAMLLRQAAVALLLAFPLSELVKNLTDHIVMRVVRPRRLPRMALEKGVPAGGKTVCVIAALLSGEGSGAGYARALEEYAIANRDAGRNLLFGILGDLPEAAERETPGDEARIRGAREAVEELNRRYGGGFYFFMREREFAPAAGCYRGYERKRGALLGLARLLAGGESRVRCLAGDEKALRGTRFIITLDSDTRLTAGSARELIGAALHPLNVPVIDERRGCVRRGHGVIQPRVTVELASAGRSDFTRIFVGQGGVDPYGSAVSDVYQDLFGRGSFTGKGIINVPAYLRCLDGAIPEGRVLSHDLVEGAYLRCAAMGDVELTDGFPYKVTAYFSRLHRWTRGDWQNARWLRGHVENGGGHRTENPLGDVDKWKIFDNLRRSLVPVFTFAALVAGMLLSRADFAAAGAVSVLALMSELLISSAKLVLRHDGAARARYHSSVIYGFAGALMRTAVRLLLLPFEAWTCLTAVVTALYRMAAPRRDLLEWVTAADAEAGDGKSLWFHYKRMAVCALAGAAVIALTPYAPAAAAGLVWLFAPAFAYALSRELREGDYIPESDRRFLLSAARDMWRYFDELATEENHFLPPDNYQEQPWGGAAERTSPTNIGLSMLAAAAAADLGVIPEGEAERIVRRTLATAERLPKWRGHLYNWYDTTTLHVLEPGYVSTVDSGNLAGHLIVLAQKYAKSAPDIAKQCETLLSKMDFSALFDEKKKLFRIGFDVSKNEPTEGWYDLLASEARQTSYIAVALGQAPRKHWRRLGRALAAQDRYSGMASWTGTMFEYLMPDLIMPCYADSLLFESAKFCVYAQRRAAAGRPWGVSESGYYAFDPAMRYRYKAHGTPKLALKRGMGREYVVAPYAAFLALSMAPKAAAANLRRMARMGMTGRYGFYEAADFTPARTGGREFAVVRQYMVHHLGMSLAAIDGFLNRGVMQRRFMADARMAAFRELLQERVPVGETVLRQLPRELPEKPARMPETAPEARYEGTDAFRPACLPLSNGSYEVLLTESGKTRSRCGGVALTDFAADVFGGTGMAFYLETEEGTFSLLPAPDYDKRVRYEAVFKAACGVIRARFGAFSTETEVTVPAAVNGERRRVTVRYSGKKAPPFRLLCVFRPVLERAEDYGAHPAFARLSLEAEERRGGMIVRRRGGGERDAFMAFLPSQPGAVRTEPERGRGPESVRFKKHTPDMRVSCAVTPLLRDGEASVSFALAVGPDADAACDAAERILRGRQESAVSRMEAAAAMLAMTGEDVIRSFRRAGELTFFTDARRGAERQNFRQEDLWGFGISGDLPLLAAEIAEEDETAGAERLLKEHDFLRLNGVRYDLALLTADGGDYRCPRRRAVLDWLHRTGTEDALGAAGGVHLLDAAEERTQAVRALADVWVTLSVPEETRARDTALPDTPVLYPGGKGSLETRFEPDGAFSFAMRGALPRAVWENVLANERFGYLATDAGTGHMWYGNARESRVSPWVNDGLALTGPERLELEIDGERRSLFADGGEEPVKVTCGLGWTCWERETLGTGTRVTAFVPRDTPCRVLLIETEKGTLRWSAELSLGSRNALSKTVRTGAGERELRAEDTSGMFAGGVFRALFSRVPSRFTTDRREWLTGREAGTVGTGFPPCMGAVFEGGGRLVIVTGCGGRETLELLTDEAVCRRALDETKSFWQAASRPFTLCTEHEGLDAYMNGWALYQTRACRLMARTSVWQNGGAYGFRDQLQDVSALAAFDPETAKRQLLRAAAHQYAEGDVQHWWHPLPGGDKGVRTRIADDLLWLPYTLCDYVEKTGDRGILDERAPYLISPPLSDAERERYETPAVSDETDTLLGHALRAADEALARGVGEHGLCLFGGGDWNDGMDEAGAAGRGESVWLTFFESIVLRRLAALCGGRRGDEYRRRADKLLAAAENAWDGGWYLRGRYDDGAPMGGAGAAECEIDSLAQSFAVFAGADRPRCRRALEKAYEKLYDRAGGLVRLFTPPFDRGTARPGYIKRYAPGFRENGGQYTHGAIWLAMALLRAGMEREGWELLDALLPGGRGEAYRGEPFVMAADVSANADNAGRAGWTWYTGAAGWYARAVTEELLGLKFRGGRLRLEPRLPAGFGRCEVILGRGEGALRLRLDGTVTVNGRPYGGEWLTCKI